MNLGQITQTDSVSTSNLKSEIDRLNELVQKLNSENQANHEKVMQAEMLEQQIEKLTAKNTELSETTGKLLKQNMDLKQQNKELEMTTSKQKDVITNITAKLKKAEDKPPKIVTEYKYREECEWCEIVEAKSLLGKQKKLLKKQNNLLKKVLSFVIIFLGLLAVKNDVIREDIRSCVLFIWNEATEVGKLIFMLSNKVSTVANIIDNETAANILSIVIAILFTVVSLILVALILFLICVLLVYIIENIDDKVQRITGTIIVISVIYLSDIIPIKQILNINILLLTLFIYIIQIVIRVIYEYKKGN